MGFVFGFDVDNHAINTVPKETLIRITKAEDGGIGGKGVWEAGDARLRPGSDTPQNQTLPGRRVRRRSIGKIAESRSEDTRHGQQIAERSFPRFIRRRGRWSRTTR